MKKSVEQFSFLIPFKSFQLLSFLFFYFLFIPHEKCISFCGDFLHCLNFTMICLLDVPLKIVNGILYILCRSDRRVRGDISNVDEMWIAFLLLYKRKIIAYNFIPSIAIFTVEYSLMVRECEKEENFWSMMRNSIFH